jgi:hypothetical protein
LNLIRVMPAKGQDVSMQKSLTIARLVGPVLAVIGSGILSNQFTYPEMPAQFLAGLPFIYFSGVLALVPRYAPRPARRLYHLQGLCGVSVNAYST